MLSYFLLFTDNSLLVTMGDGFKYSFLTVYIIEILITLVVLPFLIRLSGQLFIQTLKSYETINNASDPEEHRPYFEHYRIMFCLLFVMLMTSVLNLAKSFYLIKPLFSYYVEPISLNLVLNFWFSFQDAIISFGLLVMLQIMYFFQEKRKNFGYYLTLPILRFIWVFLVESGLFIFLILLEKFESKNSISNTSISSCGDMYIFEASSIIFICTLPMYLMRFVLIFRFAKEGNDIVRKFIGDILSNKYLRNAMGHERVENIYRATILFRSLCWGNFILAMLFTVPPLIELIYSVACISLSSAIEYSNIFFSIVLFNELIFFFTNILYAIFFVILWKFLFDRSKKVKLGGYSHFNVSRTIRTNETVPILNPITFSAKKSQKILLRYYSIVISCITVIMVGFITPLGINSWSSLLYINRGEFYNLKYTNIYKAMESCYKVNAEVYHPPPPYDGFPINCSSTYFATIGESETLYQNYSVRPFYETILWLLPNTTITGLENINTLTISLIIENDTPCMTSFEHGVAFQERFTIFDCVRTANDHSKFIANCSSSKQCQSFHETILNKSSMINIAVDHFDDNSTFSLLKQTYNLSNLSNVNHVMDFGNFEGDFDWHKYDILINDEMYANLHYFDSCPIKFSCILHYAIVLAIALFTLISTPVYLIVSVILIHRH